MRIELKRVDYFARMSEETPAFAADVWIDGKCAGQASNNGHGGPNRYVPFALEETLNEAASVLPRVAFTKEKDGIEGDYQPDADTLVGGLLSEYLTRRDFEKAIRSKVVAVKDGGLVGSKKLTAAQIEGVSQKWKAEGLQVLNLMDREEAFKLYLSHCTN